MLGFWPLMCFFVNTLFTSVSYFIYINRYLYPCIFLHFSIHISLENNSLVWNEEDTLEFSNLKVDMTSTPMFATPNFSKTFIVECDASGHGCVTMLMQ